MIDLIIPYYNNPEGLLNTLNSIDQSIFKVTIIDDHSTKLPLLPLNAAQYFRLNKNHGPATARQLGINKTSNPYITFIDSGDTFISFEVQHEMMAAIIKNPNANIISFPFFYKGEITKETDNKTPGKIYKREFLDKYNITFMTELFTMNEDIGFNRACRYCAEFENQPLLFINLPVIKCALEENSLTQKNNQEFFYKNQTYGLAVNAIHAINILKKNNINTAIEINQIAIALYYWFLRTIVERPQYIQDAWSGARVFYTELQNEIVPSNLALGNPEIKRCLQYNGKVHFPINILRFAHDIQQYEEIPKNYLGGD